MQHFLLAKSIDHQEFYRWQKERMEVEFLYPYQNQIIPTEAKSAQRVKTKSLERYILQYQPKNSIIFFSQAIAAAKRIDSGSTTAAVFGGSI